MGRSRLEGRSALQMDLPVLGKWNGRTPVILSGEWRVLPGPWADRSPAAAQAGSCLPGKEFSRKGPGVWQAAAACGPAACSCGERRQLHGDPVGRTAGSRPEGGVHCFGEFGRLHLENCVQL